MDEYLERLKVVVNAYKGSDRSNLIKEFRKNLIGEGFLEDKGEEHASGLIDIAEREGLIILRESNNCYYPKNI